MKHLSTIVLILAIFGICCGMSQKMGIDNATIEKLAGNKFRISVSGMAPTPGWKIQIVPQKYIMAPASWVMSVQGTGPDGMVIQVLTPYTHSEEFSFAPVTKEVVLLGANKLVKLNIPWPKEEKKPEAHKMNVDSADVIRVMGNKFRVTVRGMAPSPGWKVNIALEKNDNAPANWPMHVTGTPPDGMAIAMMTPYEYEQEFRFTHDTKTVTVIAQNKKVELALPWPAPRPTKQNSVAIAEAVLMPDSPQPAAVTLGHLFLVKATVPTGFVMEQKPQPSEDFEFLTFFTYSENIGAMHSVYVCKMKPQVKARSFAVKIHGENYTGAKVESEAQIMVTR